MRINKKDLYLLSKLKDTGPINSIFYDILQAAAKVYVEVAAMVAIVPILPAVIRHAEGLQREAQHRLLLLAEIEVIADSISILLPLIRCEIGQRVIILAPITQMIPIEPHPAAIAYQFCPLQAKIRTDLGLSGIFQVCVS